MAEPEIKYEYGRTPEDEQKRPWPRLSNLIGAFIPERREVITPPTTTYTNIDDRIYTDTTDAVYGPPERGSEHMPVVRGAEALYDFIGNIFSDGEHREKTGSALKQGIGTLIDDQKRAGIQAMTGDGSLSFFDAEQNRVRGYDPTLVPLTMGVAGWLAPVRGSGFVAGMFAGRNAASANPKKFARADGMASEGRSRKDIFKETGLFRFHADDGNPISGWRFEIPDDQSRPVFNPKFQTPTGQVRKGTDPTLGDLFDHPEFYKEFPGGANKSDAQVLASLEEARAEIRYKLLKLKASNKSIKESEAEYEKLQDEDGDLLAAYILNSPTALLQSVKSGPPFYGPEGMAARMSRPVADTPLKTMSSKDWGGAYYDPHLDTIGTKARPGAPNEYETTVAWDNQGKHVQPFSSDEYGKAMDKATEDFKEAGISLDAVLPLRERRKVHFQKQGYPDPFPLAEKPGGKTEYRLRKLGGGPEDVIDPESLADWGYDSLKRQWDQLQEHGTIFYKKDFDPADIFRSDMIHEGQHSIQYRTPGFEGGGNKKEFTAAKIGVVKDRTTNDKLTPEEIYMRILGEAEARLAQNRRDFTEKQRAELYPWTKRGGLDRREGDLLLRKDLGMATGGFVDKPSTTTHTDGEGSEEVSQESYMEALASGRPLADGDRRVNPDGSHSTELSISWPEKDGSWVLAPSLWRTPSGLVELPEELARDVARAYEERASMRFPRFKTQEEMSKFARERSAGGGATHTPLATPIPRPRPNATRLGVEYKAGGFVDKPLYSDARIGKMI